ncbi:hypothetical protein ABIE27_006011 [Paenibacillus sp. 4624]|uniref:hypothetical protein n=1 Tax=Paenibacillus sp. 4624 TaxID=3156453 RepID=UPI003D1CD307
MSIELSHETLRELVVVTKEFLMKHGVSRTIQLWEEAATLQVITADEKEKYLHFLLGTTATVIQHIPHFSGVEISTHAGIDPETNVPFILASSKEYDHYAKWFSRPVEHKGHMVTEVTCGWYEDGRDALCQ